MESCLFNYIRRGTNRVGVLVACKFKGIEPVYTGWSLCHKDDKFDIQEAFEIAFFRTHANYIVDEQYDNNEMLNEIPKSLHKSYSKFCDRLNKYYYKKEDIISPVDVQDCVTKIYREAPTGCKFNKIYTKEIFSEFYKDIPLIMNIINNGAKDGK